MAWNVLYFLCTGPDTYTFTANFIKYPLRNSKNLRIIIPEKLTGFINYENNGRQIEIVSIRHPFRYL
ncbi:MAG: hypothetical protein E7239_03555 [Sarcina sp.]|nr:hypothetical protein [Sarcina sp.]